VDSSLPAAGLALQSIVCNLAFLLLVTRSIDRGCPYGFFYVKKGKAKPGEEQRRGWEDFF